MTKAYKLADRVKESSNTVGTGALSLNGAVNGFATFSSSFTTGDTVPYCIEFGNEYEVGMGTLTTGTPWTLSRDTILSSSNAGLVLDLTAGSKNVFCTVPATKTPPVVTGALMLTIGASGRDFTTLEAAIDYTRNLTYTSNASVVITLDDGIHTVSSPIQIPRLGGVGFSIVGQQNKSTISVTSIASVSGSTSAWSAVLNVSSVGSVQVGDYIAFKTATGGTAPMRLCGVHEVTAVGASTITVLMRHRFATNTLAGAVTATGYVHKTILRYTGASGNLFTASGACILNLNYLLINSTTSTSAVVESQWSAVAWCGADFATVSHSGLVATNGGQLYVSNSVHSANGATSGYGVGAYGLGVCTAWGAHICTGFQTSGVLAQYRGSYFSNGAAVVNIGNVYGFYTSNGAYSYGGAYGTQDNVTAITNLTANTVTDGAYFDT